MSVQGASHREAPLIALDPAADTTDVYAFVSYDAANLARAASNRRVTFMVNVIPGKDPSDGPNYFNFDDDVLYAINIYSGPATGIRVFAGQRAESFYIDLAPCSIR